MNYLSIDIETTGLNPETCQILSIGVIAEDTRKRLSFDKIPKLNCIFLHDFIQGEPFALNLNKKIIESIVKYQGLKSNEEREAFSKEMNAIFIRPDDFTGQLRYFLSSHGISDERFTTLNVAGKNFHSFDKKFIEKLSGWNKSFRIHQRPIDAAIIFTDWNEDEKMPDLKTCKQRAGITNAEVSHDALYDAWDVVTLLRTQY